MAKRTLAQFRAERKLWRKDVAQTLGISEEELEALEREPEVPPQIAQKITAAYNLPPDYFTVDVDAMAAAVAYTQKKTPQNPLAYFYKVSLVCSILVGLAQALVSFVGNAIYMMVGITSIVNSLVSIVNTVIALAAGVLLCRYITKKTTFMGDIPQIGIALAVLSSYSTRFVEGWFPFLLPTAQESIAAAQAGESALFDDPSRMALYYVFGLVQLFVQPLFSAGILWVASMAESEARRRKRWMLFGAILASLTLYIVEMAVCYLVKNQDTGMVPMFGWSGQISLYILGVFVVLVAAIGPKELPKLNILWYTIFPLIAVWSALIASLAQSIVYW